MRYAAQLAWHIFFTAHTRSVLKKVIKSFFIRKIMPIFAPDFVRRG